MKVIVVGATGTIGEAVARALAPRHQIVRVSHSSGPLTVDIGKRDSIIKMFTVIGKADALISAAGLASFGLLIDLTDDDFTLSLTNKLMGQVNLVRLGVDYLEDRGTFTLTSGILSRKPAPGSAAISMVNAALEGFVRAAALELPRGIRINVVSPGWVSETLESLGRDPAQGTPATKVAEAYVKSLEGTQNGAVLDASGGR